jgi:hypothetical protein
VPPSAITSPTSSTWRRAPPTTSPSRPAGCKYKISFFSPFINANLKHQPNHQLSS